MLRTPSGCSTVIRMATSSVWGKADHEDLGRAYLIWGEVRLDQLDHEMAEAFGVPAPVGLILDYVGEDRVLFVPEPVGSKQDEVGRLVAEHRPDPMFFTPVDYGIDLDYALAKAKAGGYLREDELRVLVIELVRRLGD